MSERVKELIAALRFHDSAWMGGNGPLVFTKIIQVLSAEIDALSQRVETLKQAGTPGPAPTPTTAPEIDWKAKYETLHAVHDETHAALAKAGSDIHDLANKGHAYAIERLVEQRNDARAAHVEHTLEINRAIQNTPECFCGAGRAGESSPVEGGDEVKHEVNSCQRVRK